MVPLVLTDLVWDIMAPLGSGLGYWVQSLHWNAKQKVEEIGLKWHPMAGVLPTAQLVQMPYVLQDFVSKVHTIKTCVYLYIDI